jgi:DNA-binding XRE family transcriptional regulator
MITALQCKMARACLEWSIRELAEKVEVNPNTIIRFEDGGDPKSSIRDRIEKVLTKQGFVFDADGFTATAPVHLKPVFKPQNYKRAA